LIKTHQIIENELRDIFNRTSINIDAIAAKTIGKQANVEVRVTRNRLRRQHEQFQSELT
jgi:hypothetical protein